MSLVSPSLVLPLKAVLPPTNWPWQKRRSSWMTCWSLLLSFMILTKFLLIMICAEKSPVNWAMLSPINMTRTSSVLSPALLASLATLLLLLAPMLTVAPRLRLASLLALVNLPTLTSWSKVSSALLSVWMRLTCLLTDVWLLCRHPVIINCSAPLTAMT